MPSRTALAAPFAAKTQPDWMQQVPYNMYKAMNSLALADPPAVPPKDASTGLIAKACEAIRLGGDKDTKARKAEDTDGFCACVERCKCGEDAKGCDGGKNAFVAVVKTKMIAMVGQAGKNKDAEQARDAPVAIIRNLSEAFDHTPDSSAHELYSPTTASGTPHGLASATSIGSFASAAPRSAHPEHSVSDAYAPYAASHSSCTSTAPRTASGSVSESSRSTSDSNRSIFTIGAPISDAPSTRSWKARVEAEALRQAYIDVMIEADIESRRRGKSIADNNAWDTASLPPSYATSAAVSPFETPIETPSASVVLERPRRPLPIPPSAIFTAPLQTYQHLVECIKLARIAEKTALRIHDQQRVYHSTYATTDGVDSRAVVWIKIKSLLRDLKRALEGTTVYLQMLHRTSWVTGTIGFEAVAERIKEIIGHIAKENETEVRENLMAHWDPGMAGGLVYFDYVTIEKDVEDQEDYTRPDLHHAAAIDLGFTLTDHAIGNYLCTLYTLLLNIIQSTANLTFPHFKALDAHLVVRPGVACGSALPRQVPCIRKAASLSYNDRSFDTWPQLLGAIGTDIESVLERWRLVDLELLKTFEMKPAEKGHRVRMTKTPGKLDKIEAWMEERDAHMRRMRNWCNAPGYYRLPVSQNKKDKGKVRQ